MKIDDRLDFKNRGIMIIGAHLDSSCVIAHEYMKSKNIECAIISLDDPLLAGRTLHNGVDQETLKELAIFQKSIQTLDLELHQMDNRFEISKYFKAPITRAERRKNKRKH